MGGQSSVWLVAGTLALAGCQYPFASSNMADHCAAQREALAGYARFFGPSVGTTPTQGAGGYLRSLRGRGDRHFVIRTVARDLSDENSRIDGVTAAFRALRDCRIRVADHINVGRWSGEFGHGEALSNMETLRASVRRDLALASKLDARIVERGRTFRHAEGELVKLGPVTAQPRIPVERNELSSTQVSPDFAEPPADAGGQNFDMATVAELVALGEINHAKRQLLVHEITEAKRGFVSPPREP